jgi:hypothetical protein
MTFTFVCTWVGVMAGGFMGMGIRHVSAALRNLRRKLWTRN